MGDRLTLAEETARRLILAGIKPNDPGLAAIRAWNARAHERKARQSDGLAHARVGARLT